MDKSKFVKLFNEIVNRTGYSTMELSKKIGVTRLEVLDWHRGNSIPSRQHLLVVAQEAVASIDDTNQLLDFLDYEPLNEKERADHLKSIDIITPYSGIRYEEEKEEERKKVWSHRMSVMTGVIVLITGIIAAMLTFTLKRPTELLPVLTLIREQEQELSESINIINREIDTIKSQLEDLIKVPESIQVAAKIKELDLHVAELNKKYDTIGKTILASPEKALDIPMLRRDISELRNRYESEIRSLEREHTNFSETIRWVIGSIIIGIIAIAVNIFYKGK